ncbi:uncharacterized protein LOC107362029 [Tetranychus urticae]|uniref:Netrin receptor UNC5A-D-like N-terminal domain-containing protein n=1 Tax=Tetranychus urticae TaxID=32264 RepID=T1K9E9_TETUR|nr:uncharacterized protein LOC107362029 [Tetranychus urticae]
MIGHWDKVGYYKGYSKVLNKSTLFNHQHLFNHDTHSKLDLYSNSITTTCHRLSGLFVNNVLKVFFWSILIPIIFTSSTVQAKKVFPGSLIKGPWFEEEPRDAYIVNQPISLKCRVHDVLSAQFHCNHGREEDIRKRETSHAYFDPETGQRIVELTLNVSKGDIDYSSNSQLQGNLLRDDLDSEKSIYKCWCSAFGGAQRVNIDSRKASVQFSCFDCADDSAEIPNCYKFCGPIDGRWSPWSAWSTCSHDCQQVRHRTCSNPPAKYGGQDCTGPDSHIRNCTGGMCHEDTMMQYPRSNASYPDGRKPEIYILCFVIAISTALICLAVFIYVSVSQRRYKQPGSMFGDDGGGEEDGQAMLLLIQKQQQQQLQLHQQQFQTPTHSQVQSSSPSGYVHANDSVNMSNSPDEKMHLISHLNAYKNNIIDHLVVHPDALRSNRPNIETISLNQTPSHHSLSNQSQHQALYIQRSSPSPRSSSYVSKSSTPRIGEMLSRTDLDTTEDDNYGSEADYAEPFFSNFSPFNTPTSSSKPPLPLTRPPSARTEDYRSDHMKIRANNDIRPRTNDQKSNQVIFSRDPSSLRSAT